MFRSNPIYSVRIKKLDINGLYHKILIDFNYFFIEIKLIILILIILIGV
jgi:hypothetical protein